MFKKLAGSIQQTEKIYQLFTFAQPAIIKAMESRPVFL